MAQKPSPLTDPDWVPSVEEVQSIADAFAKRVAWEKAMEARGIKVHALDLTPEQEKAQIEAWHREQRVNEVVEP